MWHPWLQEPQKCFIVDEERTIFSATTLQLPHFIMPHLQTSTACWGWGGMVFTSAFLFFIAGVCSCAGFLLSDCTKASGQPIAGSEVVPLSVWVGALERLMANHLATFPDFLSLILEQVLCPGRTGMTKSSILVMRVSWTTGSSANLSGIPNDSVSVWTSWSESITRGWAGGAIKAVYSSQKVWTVSLQVSVVMFPPELYMP